MSRLNLMLINIISTIFIFELFLLLIYLLGGGTGQGGIGGGTGGVDIDLPEFILKEPYLCPFSFSVSSRSRSVLLVCGFLSGDDDAEEEVLRPKPNFFNVLLRDFSMLVYDVKQNVKIYA